MFRFVSLRRIAFALAALAVLGLTGPAAAQEQVPFKGSFEGDVTEMFDPTTGLVDVDIDAAGAATQLGRFTLDIPHVVNPATRTAVGTYQFTAANGDTLTANFTGVAMPIAPGVLYIEETATITGGTGRFAGATGSFISERLFDTIAGTTTGSFTGTISAPGP
jgi:hypothetical protein